MVEKIIGSQVDKFISLGFHDVLGQPEAQYRSSFVVPGSTRQPGLYQGKLDNLVVVDPRIPVRLVNQAVGIYEWTPVDWFITEELYPQTPYAVWTNIRSPYLGYSVEEAGGRFMDFEVGSSHLEVVCGYIANPRSVFEYAIIAGESHCGDFHATLSPFGVKSIELYPLRPDFKHPWWGVMSRGREIITLGSLSRIHPESVYSAHP